MNIFKGYPLRKIKWDDQLLMWLFSTIIFPIFVAILIGIYVGARYADATMSTEELEQLLLGYDVWISAIGFIGGLFFMTIIVLIRNIPLVNRKRLSPDEWSLIPGLESKDWKFLAGYIPLSFILFNAGSVLLESLLGPGDFVNQDAIEGMVSETPLFIMFIMLVVVAPIAEEWLFRGMIFFRDGTNDVSWLTVIVTSIIFGLVHTPTSIQAAYTYIGMGFMFAYAAKRTKSVEAAIVYHFLNNLLAFLSLALS